MTAVVYRLSRFRCTSVTQSVPTSPLQIVSSKVLCKLYNHVV